MQISEAIPRNYLRQQYMILKRDTYSNICHTGYVFTSQIWIWNENIYWNLLCKVYILSNTFLKVMRHIFFIKVASYNHNEVLSCIVFPFLIKFIHDKFWIYVFMHQYQLNQVRNIKRSEMKFWALFSSCCWNKTFDFSIHHFKFQLGVNV